MQTLQGPLGNWDARKRRTIGQRRATKDNEVRTFRFAAVLLVLATAVQAKVQTGACCAGEAFPEQLAPPAAGGKAVELSGTVAQVHIAAGQGMPYFDLKNGAEITRIYLGPMPFLIAENFHPKAGQEVRVKGYRVPDWVVAAQVHFRQGESDRQVPRRPRLAAVAWRLRTRRRQGLVEHAAPRTRGLGLARASGT